MDILWTLVIWLGKVMAWTTLYSICLILTAAFPVVRPGIAGFYLPQHERERRSLVRVVRFTIWLGFLVGTLLIILY